MNLRAESQAASSTAPDASAAASSRADGTDLRIATLDRIAPRTLYEILRLRMDVFVVEQDAAYPDLDGLDSAAGTELLWAERDGEMLATLRITAGEPEHAEGAAPAIGEPELAGLRIGRVVAAPAARGTGIARRLMEHALRRCTERAPDQPVRLNAQEPLIGWYGDFGFRPSGERYLEDGIPHVPMTLPGR